MRRANIDWMYEIASTFTVKNEISGLDKERFYAFELPKSACSATAVYECQRLIGYEFDEDYAEFLQNADGWNAFALGVGDLFGTQDYLGSDRFIEAQKLLKEAADEDGFKSLDITFNDVFPICACDFMPDLFVMKKRHVTGNTRVYWFAGYLVDEFPSFLDFFQSMRAYDIKRLENWSL